MSGYVIELCHEGTDWCVRDFDPSKDDEGERFLDKAEALHAAEATVMRFNASRPFGMLGCRLFDFTGEGA